MIVAETLRRNRKITIDHQAERQEHGELHVVEGLADGLGAVVQDVHAATDGGSSRFEDRAAAS